MDTAKAEGIKVTLLKSMVNELATVLQLIDKHITQERQGRYRLQASKQGQQVSNSSTANRDYFVGGWCCEYGQNSLAANRTITKFTCISAGFYSKSAHSNIYILAKTYVQQHL